MEKEEGSSKYNFQLAKLGKAEFNRLSQFIYGEYGIKMPDVKMTMLEGRLQKRLKVNNIANFKDYVDFVFSDSGKRLEMIHMIDVVTTNKTDFFREPVHFEFMQSVLLPEYFANNGRRPINIWSAGCSTGEEPYTLCMVLSEFKEQNPAFDFQIFASDLSTRVLKAAATAVYKEDKAEAIPMSLKKKYFLRSKDRLNPSVRVIEALRKKVSFARVNFMDHSLDVNTQFDIIFCRNVIIYFDRETQEKVIGRLCSKLKPGGYFFLGHSESIANMDVPLKNVQPTIFKRK